MDQMTKFKNALLKAKQKWFKDKSESEQMYGEGVLTRRQAKIEANEPKVESLNINQSNNHNLTTDTNKQTSTSATTSGVNFINILRA
jgi:hypothetical protein